MTVFLFKPNEPVEVHPTVYKMPKNCPALTYGYVMLNSTIVNSCWEVKDPKSGNWLYIMDEGVPDSYRAQLLLLSAAYQ